MAEFQIRPVSGRTSLRLKTWLSADALVTLTGRELPSQVGATLSGPMRALCISPGEWLIISHELEPASLREQLASELPNEGFALVDLSDGLSGLEVQGTAARELLSKGSGLDFHPRSFPAGRCARTRFAQIPLVVECLDEPDRFELSVSRSYLHYLHAWLTDAAVEFETP